MSLRLRVVSLVGAVLLLSIMLGSLAAGVQARLMLSAELNAALQGAEQTVRSAFEDLPNSDHPERDLRQLIATFNGNRHVRALLLNRDGRPALASFSATPSAPAPRWFQQLLGPSPGKIEMPLPVSTPGYRAIVLTPTADADAGGAWVQFWRFASVLVITAGLGLVLVHRVIGAAFRPLTGLSAAFARIGTGDYAGGVDEAGPPEILNLQRGFNRMAEQLAAATARNRQLNEQLLTIQEEERSDIARDLHDEIGPHLFGVNMDAEMIIALQQAGRDPDIPAQVRAIQTAVGHMQRQVRDLLGRLRPARATDFGLDAAIRELVDFWASRRPDIVFDLTLPAADEGVPEGLKEAAYRIIQEAASNSVRHASPSWIQVCVEIQNRSDLLVMVFDNGAAAPERETGGGFGLVGMRERVRALDGSLVYGRTLGAETGWSVVARLPLAPVVAAVSLTEATV